MGLGVFRNGRYWPITPWQGSWAQQEEERRRTGAPLPRSEPPGGQWPLGHNPRALTLPGRYDQHGRKLP